MNQSPRWEARFTRHGVSVPCKQARPSLTCNSYATELDCLKECVSRNKKLAVRLRKVIKEQSRVIEEVDNG